ncbi:MAG: AMP-binding protein, partial [Cupriavidus sp.]|nr:AMP-binding protein [Cupriavidus sp.]
MLPENANGIVLPETSLWYNLEVSARRYPDKTALECFGRAIRYRDLHDEATAIAGWLQREAGVRRGDRVLLYMQNCPQFIAAYLAILRADAVVVLANAMLLEDELRHIVND